MIMRLLFATSLILLSFNSTVAQHSGFQAQTRAGNSLQIVSRLDPVVINRIHGWEITLTDANGNAISGATITMQGGMPEHDHGLPTLPQVTQEIEPGRYLVEGMRFHMPGDWEISFVIETGAVIDTAVIDFTL